MSKIEMKSLIEQRKALEDQVDTITNTQNAAVWRILNLMRQQTFEGDTPHTWDRESSRNALTGTHNWPQCFTEFEIEGKLVAARGIYYGTHGYCEGETVRFPELWLRCNDSGIIAAMQVAWDQFKADKLAEVEARKRKNEESERQKLAELQEKYGSQ